MKKLAILDYGIGGLDLYRQLKNINPAFPITYFSDSGAAPYGKLDEEKLIIRVQKIINWLKNRGVEQLVIACHSASTVAYRLSGIPIVDMIAATKETVRQASSLKRLGIIGGGRTIESLIYRNYAQELGLVVVDNNAQIFSIMIENDLIHSFDFKAHIATVLDPLDKIDGLLLACTHYSVIQEQLSSYYDHQIQMLDPMEQLISQHFSNLKNQIFDKHIFDVAYTTGNVKLANQLYGLANLNVCHVTI
jgi:glutamate racemase